jgi:hypothetical protein
MDTSTHISDHAQSVVSTLVEVKATLALALGMLRMLMLVQTYDPSLDEVEHLLGDAWDSLTELRHWIDDECEITRRQP